MGEVLVTGGTGVLGTHLVRELRARGRDVRVLSRSELPSVPSGVSAVQGDVRTGAGLDAAMADVDCIVHAATSPFRRARRTEVEGVANVLATADDAGIEHVVYVSIVGVDRELVAQRRQVTGKRTRLLRVPRVGPLRDMDAGALVAGERRSFGTTTWRTWLRSNT